MKDEKRRTQKTGRSAHDKKGILSVSYIPGGQLLVGQIGLRQKEKPVKRGKEIEIMRCTYTRRLVPELGEGCCSSVRVS